MFATTRRLIEGRYLHDILEQPKAIHDTVRDLRFPEELGALSAQLQTGAIKRIVLTGMGSSFYALWPCYLDLSAHGYEVVIAETSELLYYLPHLLADDSLLVVVSQSGRSAEVVKLLERKASGAKVVAVTNSPESPLAQESNALLLTHAGEEFSVSSKSYVTSLIALEMLSAYLRTGDIASVTKELTDLGSIAGRYLDGWREHIETLADLLAPASSIFIVGRGRSLAAVGVGALITKESVRVHAEGMSSAAFRHGPMEILNERVFVGVFEGASETRKLNRELVREIGQTGAKAELIGPEALIPALRLPLYSSRSAPTLEILPIQMATIALGALLGIEAGRFALASKVTEVE
jgi:glucosamine--fructose-6-phosphate aminotransferase (isomerizing)